MLHHRPMLFPFVLMFLAAVAQADAAARVQLDLVGDTLGASLAFQQWSQRLGEAGIPNVRIRAMSQSDAVGIRTEGNADSPTYVVTGIVRSQDELIMPSGRIRPGDVGRLAVWLKDLAENGPPSRRERQTAFELTAAQLQRVENDLTAPVGFPTRDVASRDVVEKIASQRKLPLRLNAEATKGLADRRVSEELSGLSAGTALAYALQSADYGFRPHVTGGEIAYEVAPLRAGAESWPIGKTEGKTPAELLPGLFEFLNVNIENVSAATALEAIGKRLKTPVLFDHPALARHAIAPAQKLVSLPSKRTTYDAALRRLLFQAGMKYELRCDEAGSPFLWVTSLKPR